MASFANSSRSFTMRSAHLWLPYYLENCSPQNSYFQKKKKHRFEKKEKNRIFSLKKNFRFRVLLRKKKGKLLFSRWFYFRGNTVDNEGGAIYKIIALKTGFHI